MKNIHHHPLERAKKEVAPAPSSSSFWYKKEYIPPEEFLIFYKYIHIKEGVFPSSSSGFSSFPSLSLTFLSPGDKKHLGTCCTIPITRQQKIHSTLESRLRIFEFDFPPPHFYDRPINKGPGVSHWSLARPTDQTVKGHRSTFPSILI